jgi:hypothetical protein
MARLYGRLVIAVALVFSAILLHVGLCEWELKPRARHTMHIVLWWIKTEPAPATPLPAAPGANAATAGYGRYLRAQYGASGPDTWIFGVVAPILLIAGAAAILLQSRRSYRLAKGRCPSCGYDLRFDAAGGCPECGWGGRTWPSA